MTELPRGSVRTATMTTAVAAVAVLGVVGIRQPRHSGAGSTATIRQTGRMLSAAQRPEAPVR
jgi:hypothetical protein